MKKVTSILTMLFLCLYVTAQVGTPDEGFNTSGNIISNVFGAGLPANNDVGQAIAVDANGRVVVAVNTNQEYFTVVRYTATGTLDGTFGGGTGVVSVRQTPGNTAQPFAITVLSDNSILVAGSTWNATKDFTVLKLSENGTPDASFGTGGWAITPVGSGHDEARGIAVQGDGKIVVTGYAYNGANNDFAVVRYNADGSLDAAGFSGGIVTANISGNDMASGLVLQTDGKIVIAGTSDIGGNENFTAVRYNTDGTLDAAGYGTGGIANVDLGNNGAGSEDVCNAIAIQADGKIVLTGRSIAVAATNNDIATLRLTTAGIPDASFNGDGNADGIIFFDYIPGIVNTDEGAYAIAIQNDGKMLVCGDTNGASSDFAFLMLRYNSDGSLDTNFNGTGIVTTQFSATDDEIGLAMKLFGNRIYIAGSVGAPKDLLLAAFENDGTPLPLVLSQFYAQKQTNKVVLQWSTTSEEGVKQFIVERSSDGKKYKAIGTVAAVGNSTFAQKYSFADASPFMSANNYYRLLIQDADGNYKYSKMLIIKFDGLLTTELKVNPSLVKDLLQVQIPDGMQGSIGLQVIDMNGRVLRKTNIASDGNALNTTIDVSSLIKGVYILKATAANNTTAVSRFTKQ